MDTVLSVKNLSKAFPGVQALDDVSMDVGKGEIHALLGENGAGKSTFIKIVSGVINADAGEIFVEGKRAEIKSPADAVKHGISVVHQELNIVPWLDVVTNFMLGQEKASKGTGIVDKRYSIAKARESLAMLGLNIDVTKKMGQLSFGEQQMVMIAKIISTNPKVIIMDEPTAALAQKERDNLYKVVRLLRDRGIGIIYITHIFDEVFSLVDRVTVLRDGQYIGTRSRSEINANMLIKMVVGREVKNVKRDSCATDDTIMEVRNLSVENKLHDISFMLKRGEILGINGLAGAGRSELLRAVFGADPKTSGEIFVDGRRVEIRSPYDAYQAGIAFVPEERKSEGLMMEMSMEYNVACASLYKATNRAGFLSYKKIKKLALNAVDRFTINPATPMRKAKLFSGGNQQKIVVSKCVNADPKILLVDEPTRGVDIGAKTEIHMILDQMAREGKSIIVVSSEMDEVLKLSDRVLVMRAGRIVAELKKDEINQETIIAFSMGGSING